MISELNEARAQPLQEYGDGMDYEGEDKDWGKDIQSMSYILTLTVCVLLLHSEK